MDEETGAFEDYMLEGDEEVAGDEDYMLEEDEEGADTDSAIETFQTDVFETVDSWTKDIYENDDAVQNAMECYASNQFLTKADSDGGTMIYTAMKPRSSRVHEKRLSFCKWLLKLHPDLLAVETHDRKTPLHKSVTKSGYEEFFALFCTAYPEQTSRILNKPNDLLHQMFSPNYMKQITQCLGLKGFDKNTIKRKSIKDGNTLLHLAAVSGSLELVKKLIDACPEVLEVQNRDMQSPYQYCMANYPELAACNSDDSQPSARSPPTRGNTPHKFKGKTLPRRKPHTKSLVGKGQFDDIAFELMDRYMHLPRDETIKFLYGDIQRREIQFDLQELENITSEISEKRLKDLVNGLTFENILQYVRLPQYKSSMAASPSSKDADLEGGIGRRDYGLIFQWLRDRGVKKIIKIIVDDDDDIPHSDDIIESLSDFGIEVLDWRKVDLCSTVIQKAANGVREVYLYSNGNNAVLRSWSGPDGLCMLKGLRIVHLSLRQRLESTARIRNDLKKFTTRLAENCTTICCGKEECRGASICSQCIDCRIAKDKGSESVEATNWFEGADQVETNDWLDNMKKFAGFIKNFPSPRPSEKIKVAVIDDGIDRLHGKLNMNIQDGASFCNCHPYYFSSNDHGTLMATLIRQICPEVSFYIARLHEGRGSAGALQIDAWSAAKAIRWATAMNVQIISISWTLYATDKNKSDIAEVTSAITEAVANKILIFASTNDRGLNDSRFAYPAGCNDVFKIGAAKRSGHAGDGVESNRVDFVFPGEDIRLPKLGHSAGVNTVSGSSLATALAAGLAALILYCVQLSESHNKEYREKLDYSGMRQVLRGMVQDDQKYIFAKRWIDGSKFQKCDGPHEKRKGLEIMVQDILGPLRQGY